MCGAFFYEYRCLLCGTQPQPLPLQWRLLLMACTNSRRAHFEIWQTCATSTGRRMTQRTSPSNDHNLKRIAFWANTGLSETEFTTFNRLELSEPQLANERENISNQNHNHTTPSPWINHRQVRSMLSPLVSSRPHGFLPAVPPNAGHTHPNPKSRAQPRIEKT